MMNIHRSTCAAAVILALALPACALPADDEPATSEATGELGTAGHWSQLWLPFGRTWQPAQVGSINGRTLMIRAGFCGDWLCFAGENVNSLDYYEYAAAQWNGTYPMPSQSTRDKVSVAPFNGYLYMAHMGGNDDTHTTYLTKFDPTTSLWDPDQPINFPTTDGGPPALAALNGKLYFIGSKNDGTNQMWYGTMDANRAFSQMTDLAGHTTTGRINATAAFGKIIFTHRDGTSTNLVTGSTADGVNWNGPSYIYGGANNGALQGQEAAIAFDGSRLHLVHKRPGDSYIWWTQYDNCNWSTSESQLSGFQSDHDPSLGAGGAGLILLVDKHNQHWYDVSYAEWTPPSMPSRCLVNHQ